jgi:hypothetical protein
VVDGLDVLVSRSGGRAAADGGEQETEHETREQRDCGIARGRGDEGQTERSD